MSEARSVLEIVSGIEQKLDKLNNDLMEIKLERKMEQGSISAIKWVFGVASTILGALIIGIITTLFSFYHATIDNDKVHTANIQILDNRVKKLEEQKSR